MTATTAPKAWRQLLAVHKGREQDGSKQTSTSHVALLVPLVAMFFDPDFGLIFEDVGAACEKATTVDEMLEFQYQPQSLSQALSPTPAFTQVSKFMFGDQPIAAIKKAVEAHIEKTFSSEVKRGQELRERLRKRERGVNGCAWRDIVADAHRGMDDKNPAKPLLWSFADCAVKHFATNVVGAMQPLQDADALEERRGRIAQRYNSGAEVDSENTTRERLTFITPDLSSLAPGWQERRDYLANALEAGFTTLELTRMLLPARAGDRYMVDKEWYKTLTRLVKSGLSVEARKAVQAALEYAKYQPINCLEATATEDPALTTHAVDDTVEGWSANGDFVKRI